MDWHPPPDLSGLPTSLIVEIERIAKVRPRELLEQSISFGVLVRRLRDVVPGDSAKYMFCTEEGEQAFTARA